MSPQVTAIQSAIESRLIANDLSGLFTSDLAWHSANPPEHFSVEEALVEKLASLAGVTVWLVKNAEGSSIATIEREIAKRSSERLVIVDRGSIFEWRWPEKRPSGNVRTTSLKQAHGNAPLTLVQRLVPLRFEIQDQEKLTVLDVRERVRRSFSSEEVTNRFYIEFRKVHTLLAGDDESVGTIEGIQEYENCHWYASVLMNRLMFLYFLEKKGFLDNDENYLASRLSQVRKSLGPDQFYGFYSNFLIPLFHDAIGSTGNDFDKSTAKLIGDVPYLNGGLFAPHELEINNAIEIPDSAFEEIFNFFDSYRWHLDERASATEGEINPEILGYIFEKYVNQKQQGAYYTKEDVTGYMSVGTILPVLIERVAELVGDTPWRLVAEQPDRYMPESSMYGMGIEIPEGISLSSIGEYGPLDASAAPSVGLPGERWREACERLDHSVMVHRHLQSGSLKSCSEALDLNLDLVTLFVDWVASFNEAEQLENVWNTIISFNVIDPTCGSGAFLFAAMDVLEEIYEAVISRASELLAIGLDTPKDSLHKIVGEMSSHPSPSYFLLKTIVLENIYGVDIMAEAIEIARLRLFLSLAARLQHRSEIEPLPDLDMNVKVGNILVGCSTYQDAEETFSGDIIALTTLDSLKPKVDKLVVVYNEFIEVQRGSTSGAKLQKAKESLSNLSEEIRNELDLLYASATGVSINHLDEWRASHLPFHWFLEFPEAITSGGFDAVIGNPPYISKRKLSQYKFSGFTTDSCQDIFAPCMERAAAMTHANGAFAMIVPIAFQFSDDYKLARHIIAKLCPRRWVTSFSRRPSALFDAGVRPSIVLGLRSGEPRIATGFTRRWQSEFRPHLFQTMRVTEIQDPGETAWPRIGYGELGELYKKMTASSGTLGNSISRSGDSLGFKQTALYYMSVFVEDPPAWDLSGNRIPQTQIGRLTFRDDKTRDIAHLALSGRLAFWWWSITSDDFHVTGAGLRSLPIALNALKPIEEKLIKLGHHLQQLQMESPLVTKYNGMYVGNYDMLACRKITDKSDKLILDQLGLSKHWKAILLADALMFKSTGKKVDAVQEWPFAL